MYKKFFYMYKKVRNKLGDSLFGLFLIQLFLIQLFLIQQFHIQQFLIQQFLIYVVIAPLFFCS